MSTRYEHFFISLFSFLMCGHHPRAGPTLGVPRQATPAPYTIISATPAEGGLLFLNGKRQTFKEVILIGLLGPMLLSE